MTVKHLEVEIVLDKSQYGKSAQTVLGPGFSFYYNTSGKFEYITTRNERQLVAVTDEQYRGWKGRKIVAVPITLT